MKSATPIKDLSELLQWEPDIEFIKRLVPLTKCNKLWDDRGKIHNLSSKIPQVIYCHDMAGGYLEADREFGMTSVFPAFRFTRWHLIDIFIYFSHNFVTLPPLTWINLAHRQGVRVYGTVIFESFNDSFRDLFTDEIDGDMDHFGFAHRLDWIRRLLGFEGWLINFEVCLPRQVAPQVVDRILNFLRLLKRLGSEVIWYDAVTRHGRLNFQNALTDENDCFLQTGIDGIFLNYNWNDKRLQQSQRRAKDAVTSARIFVGVDCFGRGCPGGGGFGTSVALQMILNAIEKCPDRPLSVALFAPGWPFEKCDLTDARGDPFKAHHLVSQWDEQFWAPLAPLLSRIRGVGSESLGLYRPTVMCLPAVKTLQALRSGCNYGVVLQSTCCTGEGLLCPERTPRSSMCLQEIMPTFRDCSSSIAVEGPTRSRLVQALRCARCGPIAGSGSCVSLQRFASLRNPNCPLLIELFSFAPGTLVSHMAYVELAVLPHGCSTPVFSLPTDAPLTSYRQTLGLALFVDILDGVCDKSLKNSNGTVYRRLMVPFQRVAVVERDDMKWLFLTFPFNVANDSDSNSELSLYRFGLSWSNTEPDNVPITKLLLGSIALHDPNWLTNAVTGLH